MTTKPRKASPLATSDREGHSRSRDLIIAGIGLSGALLGATIGLIATILATSSANTDQVSLQVRQMKQAQYATTYKAVDLEIQSMSSTLAALQQGNVSEARKDTESYNGTDQVVEQLAALPLVANDRVLSAGLDYLKDRNKFISDLYSAALAFNAGDQGGERVAVVAAEKQLSVLRNSEGSLLIAMRLDLNIPSGS